MRDKTYTITATYDGAIPDNTIERKQRNMVAEPICVNSKSGRGDKNNLQPSVQERIYDISGKATAVTGGFRTNIAEPVGIASRGRGEPAEQHIEARMDEKSNAVTTVGKDSMVAEPIIHNAPHGYNSGSVKECIKAPTLTSHRQYSCNSLANFITNGGFAASGISEKVGYYTIPTEFDEQGKPTKAISTTDGKEHMVYEVKDGQITIKGKTYPIKLIDGYYIIRKLTVRECMRLQTVPEWYEFPVSNSQAYKLLGNGWTCEVITHLIKACLSGKTAEKQITLI